MTGAVFVRLVLVGSITLSAEGCGSQPTQPDPRIPPAVGPPSSMQINTWHFGTSTSTAHVIATWGDLYSTSRDVTAEARWTSSSPDIMAVTGPGALTSVSPGDADVRAEFNGVAVVQSLRVYVGEGPLMVTDCANPTSCFYTDAVRDSTRSFPSNGIEGAIVTITSGHNAGRSAVTDKNGYFQFFSPLVWGPITIRASKSGYRDGEVSWIMGETSSPPLLLVPQTN
jgi:hypothetical protein